jgi:hypothetical protein
LNGRTAIHTQSRRQLPERTGARRAEGSGRQSRHYIKKHNWFKVDLGR